MRIGHLRASEFFGGPERGIVGQCLNMEGPRFCCMSFVRAGGGNPFLDRCAAAGIPVRAIPERGVGDFGVVGRIRAAIDELGLDVVVSHEYKSNVMATLALRGSRAAHVRHFRGFTWENPKVRFYNWIDRQCMRRMDRILAVSAGSADILAGYGIPREHVTVVPNAIESAKLVGDALLRRAQPDGPLRLVAAGRLSPEKGQDVLARALALLPAEADVVVDVYGDGPGQAALERQIDALGIAGRMVLRGFVDDVLPILKAADGMVLPSRSEGMPNILLEAWSQKAPVISTTVGGVPEMVEDGATGLLCPPEDPEALAARMAWAAGHRDAFALMGEAGHDVVSSRYTYAAQAALLERVYSEAMACR